MPDALHFNWTSHYVSSAMQPFFRKGSNDYRQILED